MKYKEGQTILSGAYRVEQVLKNGVMVTAISDVLPAHLFFFDYEMLKEREVVEPPQVKEEQLTLFPE